MANQIEGVTERLLECAVKEFLHKGYSDASLRNIAAAAETSTSSIYVRFGGKAGLFSAITDAACEDFLSYCKAEIERFNSTDPGMEKMLAFKAGIADEIIDKIYDNFDAFSLLAERAEGASFAEFLGRVSALEAEQTLRYINAAGLDAVSSGRLTVEMLHTLCAAYWMGTFEAVRLGLSRKEAKAYYLQLKNFFRAGWTDLFFPKQ